ncbi:MAG: hypothetical protein WBL63_00665 [Candidatus Acidiferrum sp.]
MKQAAVGFRVHSGWSAVVTVCLEKGAPVVLHRKRVHLVDTFSYTFRQPYHTAEKMELPEARKFISQSQAKARDLAYRAIHGLKAELEVLGYELNRSALLLASGRPLPELEKILASHALIHTADGELFRECLLHASERCGLVVACIKDRELLEQAANVLRMPPPSLLKRATELGRPFGAPWSQDEKFATVAAWFAALPSSKSSRKTIARKPA